MSNLDFESIVRSGTMPFLVAGRNQWIDGNDDLKHFDSMENKYMLNCYKWAVKWKVDNTIEDEVAAAKKQYELSDDDAKALKIFVKNLANEKCDEIVNELDKRGVSYDKNQ